MTETINTTDWKRRQLATKIEILNGIQSTLSLLETPAIDKIIEELSYSICEYCGKEWNSEYHMSDQCVDGVE